MYGILCLQQPELYACTSCIELLRVLESITDIYLYYYYITRLALHRHNITRMCKLYISAVGVNCSVFTPWSHEGLSWLEGAPGSRWHNASGFTFI